MLSGTFPCIQFCKGQVTVYRHSPSPFRFLLVTLIDTQHTGLVGEEGLCAEHRCRSE